MTIDNTYAGDKISIFSSPKHGPYLRIDELVRSLLDHISDEVRADFISRIVCSFEFHKALAALLATGSDGIDDEQSSWSSSERDRYAADVVRKQLLPHAEPATRKLVEHLIKANSTLHKKMEEGEEYLKKILADWPEPYKKYVPKRDVLYSYVCLTDNDVQKVIAIFTEQQKRADDLVKL